MLFLPVTSPKTAIITENTYYILVVSLFYNTFAFEI